MNLYDIHKDLLDKAVNALHERTFFAAYPEFQGAKVYAEDADKSGRGAFKAHLNTKFEELQQEAEEWVADEVSPYTQEKLTIEYPSVAADKLVENAQNAFNEWRKVSAADRAGILIRISRQNAGSLLRNCLCYHAYNRGKATMMAFQASGPHAADRALEAIAAGYEELNRFPAETTWDKPMGKYNLVLNKTWRAVPKGVGARGGIVQRSLHGIQFQGYMHHS